MALTQWQLKPVATDTIVSGDFIAFTDESETGDPINKLTVDNLATFFAGTGISASSGVLSVDASQAGITTVGTIGTGVWQGTPVTSSYINAAQTGITSLGTQAADFKVGNGYGLVIGHTAQLTALSLTSEAQIIGTTEADSSLLLYASATSNAVAPGIIFIKSASGTVGTETTIVVDTEEIGTIDFGASDGGDIANQMGRFKAVVDDASPAANDIGLAYVWMQQGGGGVALRETMRLSAAGDLSLAGDVLISDAKYVKLGGTRAATTEPNTNQTGYGVVVMFDSAGSVALGDAVFINTSGKVAQANAVTGSVTNPAIGIALNAGGSDGDDVYVLTHGVWRNDSEDFSGSVGGPVYLGETVGAITKTAPSTDGDYVQRLGISISEHCMLVMPSIDVIEHA